MLRSARVFILIVFVDIVLLFSWAIILFPFSSFSIVFALILGFLPKDQATYYLGNIIPLLIIPIAFGINMLLFISLKAISTNSKLKLALLYFGLSVSAILITILIYFGPTAGSELWMKYSVTNNINISGKPTFLLEKTSIPGNVNLLIYTPVTIGVPFKGIWMGTYFDIKFIPDNEVIVDSIGECKLEFSGVDSIQPPRGKDINPPGEYVLTFEYSFTGPRCTAEQLTSLANKRLMLVTKSKNPSIIFTLTISNLHIKEYSIPSR